MSGLVRLSVMVMPFAFNHFGQISVGVGVTELKIILNLSINNLLLIHCPLEPPSGVIRNCTHWVLQARSVPPQQRNTLCWWR